jgi:hypothetical protein
MMQFKNEIEAVLGDLTLQPSKQLLEIYELVEEETGKSDHQGNQIVRYLAILRDDVGRSYRHESYSDYDALDRQFFFATDAQEKIDELTAAPLPACPLHPHPMSIAKSESGIRWKCSSHPDMSCGIGEYWRWRQENVV